MQIRQQNCFSHRVERGRFCMVFCFIRMLGTKKPNTDRVRFGFCELWTRALFTSFMREGFLALYQSQLASKMSLHITASCSNNRPICKRIRPALIKNIQPIYAFGTIWQWPRRFTDFNLYALRFSTFGKLLSREASCKRSIQISPNDQFFYPVRNDKLTHQG